MIIVTDSRCNLHKSMLVILLWLGSSRQLQSNEASKYAYNSTMLNVKGNFTNKTNYCNCTNDTSRQLEQQSLHDGFYDDTYIANIASVTIDSIGMLCNILLILAIIIDPMKILRRGAWITILNLSFADFTACLANFLITLPFLMKQNWTLFRGHAEILSFLWMFGSGASFMQLTLLTAQIYMIIKYPMERRLLLTGRRIILACAMVWTLAIGLGLCEIAHIWSDSPFHFYIGNIAVLELTVIIQVVLKILIVVEIFRSRESFENTENRKHRNVAKTVIMLNVILIVTALPYFMAKQIEFITRINGSSNSDELLENFPYHYQPICLLNFVVNPVLYSLRMQDYRRSLIALFKLNCKRRRRRSSSESERIMMTNKTSWKSASSRL